MVACLAEADQSTIVERSAVVVLRKPIRLRILLEHIYQIIRLGDGRGYVHASVLERG